MREGLPSGEAVPLGLRFRVNDDIISRAAIAAFNAEQDANAAEARAREEREATLATLEPEVHVQDERKRTVLELLGQGHAGFLQAAELVLGRRVDASELATHGLGEIVFGHGAPGLQYEALVAFAEKEALEGQFRDS